MTLLAEAVAGEVASTALDSEVREALREVVPPRVIRGEVIGRYLRKALRNGVWRLLTRSERALLWLSSRIVTVVKSPLLADALKRLFVEIELGCVRGRALYYGLIVAVRSGMFGSVREALRDLQAVLCLGISYINNPPVFRSYG